jgi:hypothetical protein
MSGVKSKESILDLPIPLFGLKAEYYITPVLINEARN